MRFPGEADTRQPVNSFGIFPEAAAPRRWKKAVVLLFCLLVGIGSLLYAASPYPTKPYGLIVTPDTIKAMDEAFAAGNGWKLLLPYAYYKRTYDRYGWSPTTLFPLYFLEKVLKPEAVYIGLALLTACVLFVLSYSASGSFAFSAIFSIFISCGTHLHFIFTFGNTNIFYILYIYATIHLYAMFRILRDSRIKMRHHLFLFFSSLPLSLASDHWIAYACGVIGSMTLLLALCVKNKEKELVKRVRGILVSICSFLAVYVVIRSLYAGEHLSPGTEEELIFTHKQFALMLDDLVNNFFTFLYMVLTNFLPPIPYLDGSQTLIMLDKTTILAGQNGYHPSHTELVWYSHVFMWRYAAGIVIAVFFAYAYRWLKDTWKYFSVDSTVKFLFCAAICCSFSFYLLIKMRPYNSMPALGYKVSFGVFFFSLFLSWCIVRLRKRMQAGNFAFLYGGCIAVVVLTFLTKPYMLSKWLRADGLVGMWRSPLTDFLSTLW